MNGYQKTILFLKVDQLSQYGIGQPDDLSFDDCLEGILTAIQKDKKMELLSQYKAVVISNGIDSAFLITFKERGDIKSIQVQVFFRHIRTKNFYQSGSIPEYNAFMVASCLRELVALNGNDVMNSTDEFCNSLKTGIKDGLWRMLLQFHLGYPEPQKADETDIKPKEDLYRLIYNKELVVPETALGNNEKNLYVTHDTPLDNYNGDDMKMPSATWQSRFWKYCTTTENAATYRRSLPRFMPPWLIEQWWDKGGQDTEAETDADKRNRQSDFLNNIVRRGLRRLSTDGNIQLKFPFAHFGEWDVADPEEIGMFRSLHALMRKYISNENDKKPFGLAVFGAPGSGKSHGVIEIAKHAFNVEKKEDLKLIECNLAQFMEPDDLYRKLMEARSSMTRDGQVPIIFLDEFDAKLGEDEFGWFKHLLAPLQDGTFTYDKTLFHIGKAFIVCAGGLNHSFQEFEWKSSEERYKHAKITDLISRLKWHVNIKGLNPYFPFPLEDEKTRDKIETLNNAIASSNYEIDVQEKVDTQTHNVGGAGNAGTPTPKKWNLSYENIKKMDPLYEIRRAVLLQSLLKSNMSTILENDTLNVDLNVLHALLHIPVYKYGIRSMETIIKMSRPASRDARRFTKSMIPPPAQLEMHVDAAKFYELMEEADKKNETENEK